MPRRNVGPGWHVYLLRCADGSLYCGVARDVAKRVAAHNAGRGARYTRARRPVELVWRKRCRSQSAALQDEYAIKQLSRAEKYLLAGGRCRWSRGRLVLGSSPRGKVAQQLPLKGPRHDVGRSGSPPFDQTALDPRDA